MHVERLEREQRLPVAVERAFDLFSDARNLEAITPPWLRFRVVTPGPLRMQPGTLIEYRLRLRGVPLRWLTRIVVWEPPSRFVDVQLRGPYALWEHAHAFSPLPDGGTLMRDSVRYALPLGPLGRLARGVFVRRDLERIFDFRRDRVERLLREPGGPSTLH